MPTGATLCLGVARLRTGVGVDDGCVIGDRAIGAVLWIVRRPGVRIVSGHNLA